MRSSDDLLVAVRAALDETERIARALGGEGWNAHEPAHGMRRVTVNYSTECVVACILSAPGEHIALHDPAAVLRRVAADRYLLAAYEAAAAEYAASPHPYQHGRLHGLSLAVSALASGLGIDLEETTP